MRTELPTSMPHVSRRSVAPGLVMGPSPSPRAITVAASFGFALVQLDVTIINVALPHIGDALAADVR